MRTSNFIRWLRDCSQDHRVYLTNEEECISLGDDEKLRNNTKSKVRAKVEHPFLILKRVFGFTKVRYRVLDKNANRLFNACGLVNLYMARRRLLRPREGTCACNLPLTLIIEINGRISDKFVSDIGDFSAFSLSAKKNTWIELSA